MDQPSRRSLSVGFNVGLAIVVVLLIVLLVHVAYVMWRIVRPAARTGTGKTAAGAGIIVDAAAHLARADALARAGRYAEALGHRFLAVVLELDRMKAVRFHGSKTPPNTSAKRVSPLPARIPRRPRRPAVSPSLRAVPCDAGEYETFGAAAQELARGRNVLPA